MNVSQQGKENHQAVLHIELEPERVERALQHAARHVAQRYRIPGFRPGKAPYNVIVQRFGRDALFEEALEELGPQVYQEAVKEAGLEPFAPGSINVLEREPLTFKALVPLMPEVDPGDYKNVKVEVEDPEFTDTDLEDILENLQTEQAAWNTVDRPAQLEDRVAAHVLGTLDGETMIDTTDEFQVTDASFRDFPPDFADEVIGMRAGESREFSLTYPEDAEREALRGKAATFNVTVNEVKERELPPLDDDFAKGLNLSGVETLDQLKERITVNETARRTREARDKVETEVMDAVLGQAVVNYPPIIVLNELEYEVERQEQAMRNLGLTLESYLRFTNQTPDAFRATLAPAVEKRVQRALLLDEIAKRENIGTQVDESDEERGAGDIRRLALDWLVEQVAGVAPDWPNVDFVTDEDEDDDTSAVEWATESDDTETTEETPFKDA